MSNYIIKNVNVYEKEHNQFVSKDILISNGVFVSSIVENEKEIKYIDGTDKLLLPGIIDLHNDEIEKMLAPKRENFFCEFDVLDKLMVGYYCNGITTVFLAISYSSEPGIRNIDNTNKILQTIRDYKKKFKFRDNIFVNLRIEMSADWSNLIDFINKYKNEIRIITFCDHSPNNLQNWDEKKYYRYISSRSKINQEQFKQLILKLCSNRRFNVLALKSVITQIKEYNIKVGFHDIDRYDDIVKYMDFGEFPTNFEIIHRLKTISKPIILGAPNIRNGKSINSNISAFEACTTNMCDILCSDYDKNAILKSISILEKQANCKFFDYYKLVSENPASLLKMRKGIIKYGNDADCILIDMNLTRAYVYKTFIKGEIAYESCF